ncbi:MAG: helix-turn-helix domain-containing protein [Pseudooceanicola sp.]
MSAPLPVEILRARLRSVCGDFALEPPPGKGAMPGDISLRRQAGLEFACLETTPAVITRDPASIRRAPLDFLYLIVQLNGTAVFDTGGAAVSLQPGDMFLADADRASRLIYRAGRSRQLSIHLPRNDVRSRYGRGVAGGLHLSRSAPLVQALRMVLDHAATTADAGHDIGENALGLLGSILKDSVGHPVWTCSGERILAKALVLIGRHATDPGFGPVTLARMMNVSNRSLQRAFALSGRTPRDTIAAKRLSLAHAALSSGRAPNIAWLAAKVGYGDLSTFHREFRRTYGQSPGATRPSG